MHQLAGVVEYELAMQSLKENQAQRKQSMALKVAADAEKKKAKAAAAPNGPPGKKAQH